MGENRIKNGPNPRWLMTDFQPDLFYKTESDQKPHTKNPKPLASQCFATEIPHEISIALPCKTRRPTLDYPPLDVYLFSRESYEAGVERHLIDGVNIPVYSVEKTLVDCFKFRNKLGMGMVLEALKLYRERKPFKADLILQHAETCRVAKIIRPYLEASL